jgi:parallel beta-helix repeat protein
MLARRDGAEVIRRVWSHTLPFHLQTEELLMHKVSRIRSSLFLLVCAVLPACQKSPAEIQKHLQEDLIRAKQGAVIELPEGKFHFDRTLSLTVDKVTLRGRGMDKTILSFAGQKEGAQGLLVKANDFTIEDIGIEDSAGDALTVQGSTNITIRRVRAEWTRGPNEANGPYAIYPVECKNVLVEDSVARGAADAGIYVGQSENVVLRRNRSERNVDGFEIENSENVDAYENVSTHNTGGMGVFNLPNLPRQGGRHVRVFKNQIVDNNTPNFAPKALGPIHDLPTGTGLYVMAIKDVEIFENKIQGNNSFNVFLIHYKTGVSDESLQKTSASEITRQIFAPEDKRYYPFLRDVNIHDNEISGGGKSPDSRVGDIQAMAAALGGGLPDILYDGMVDPAWGKKGENPGNICLVNNGAATFLNIDVPGQMKHPVHDVKKYGCTLPGLSAVSIPQTGGAVPAKGAGTD